MDKEIIEFAGLDSAAAWSEGYVLDRLKSRLCELGYGWNIELMQPSGVFHCRWWKSSTTFFDGRSATELAAFSAAIRAAGLLKPKYLCRQCGGKGKVSQYPLGWVCAKCGRSSYETHEQPIETHPVKKEPERKFTVDSMGGYICVEAQDGSQHFHIRKDELPALIAELEKVEESSDGRRMENE